MNLKSRALGWLPGSALVLVLMLVLGAFGASLSQAQFLSASAVERDVSVILQSTVRTLDGSLPERTASLPSQHLRSPRSFKTFSMVSDFFTADPSAHALWSLYITSFAHGGYVSINGVDVGVVQTSTEDTTVWHTRPYLFAVPANVLRRGVNQLEVRWGASESLTLLSSMYVGPMEVLEPPYRNRLFWQNTMAEVALVHALVIAVILLGIFALRRHQTNYLFLGLGAVGFSVIVSTYMLPPMPAGLYPYWRATHIGGIALFTIGAWLFLLREAQPENRWFPRFCIAYGACGPLIYLVHFAITGLTFFKTFETIWGGLSGLIGLYPVSLLLRSLWQKWTWRNLVFVLATLCAIVMGVSDILLQGTAKGLFGGAGYGLQMVSPLWFSALTLVLVADFAGSLLKEDEQRARLAEELTKREHELAILYEANQNKEREKAALQERQRIMQDMHDGLGSHLISSLVMTEQGQVTPAQMSLLLRECIDDLRLAIDTFSSEDDHFGIAVGNLRFRMAPRMKAAGIELRWSISDLPGEVNIPPIKALPLLRVLQEALTNVLKHAYATRVEVEFAVTEGALHFVVHDNGQGFPMDKTRRGKGLSGIEKRARDMGATLSIQSWVLGSADHDRDSGTRIALTLALIEGS